MRISSGDVIWSYLSKFFSIFSGILVLPIVLNKLTVEEVAMNYLMLTITALVNLFDFGFSSQFARNITYVFSGAKHLEKEGVNITSCGDVDFHLLKTLIETAKYIYKRLSFAVLFFTLTIGSVYVYSVTDGFGKIPNILYIWLIYVASIYFNFYFLYYNSLLLGRGYIKESQKANIFSKATNIIIALVLLFLDYGLIGLVIANFISPFVGRYISHYYFYDENLKKKFKAAQVTSSDIKSMFLVVWYNAKKVGMVSLAGFAVSQSGLFFSGLYLSLDEVASYGLMVQIVGAIAMFSSTLIGIQAPIYGACRVQNDNKRLLRHFSFAIDLFYLLYAIGFVLLIWAVPPMLVLIKSNVTLPSLLVLCLYSLIALLESNHSNFSNVLASNNNIPYLKAALISGVCVIVGVFIVLKFTSWGMLGLVLVPGIVQGTYQNWKWPMEVCKEFKISYYRIVSLGVSEINSVVCSFVKK